MLLLRCWKWQSPVRSKLHTRGYSSALDESIGPKLSRPVQSYISRSRDPYINLSIEHFLLQKSSPDSAVLFQCVNRPSIIIGRNQNPWLEVNLGILKAGASSKDQALPQTEPPELGDVDLVRRRSGGGTVFHDEGNVNWTVISPSATFTRDKHAEMVVRALRKLDVQRSRVNVRHDIVLDQGVASSSRAWGPEDDTHSTPWQTDNPRSLKVSGSAYKLTRQRALHHGTALLNSPNLNIIPHYLHSPAKPFIKARGVESVSSPVGNILLKNEDFIEVVQREFQTMYGGPGNAEAVGEDWLEIELVQKGWQELKSAEWTYLQTPQFTLSNSHDNEEATFHMDVKNGLPIGLDLKPDGRTQEHCMALLKILEQRNLHEIRDWPSIFQEAGLGSCESNSLAKWIGRMLPVTQ